jgi:hypothetical protein
MKTACFCSRINVLQKHLSTTMQREMRFETGYQMDINCDGFSASLGRSG